MSNAIVVSNYQGFRIGFSEDGWFDATAAAEKFGKRVDVWLKTKETDDYIAALSRHLNTTNRRDLIKSKRGRFGGGTWFHPRLAIPFARWCSADFGVWCDLQIDQIVRGNHPHYDWKRIRSEATSSYKVMGEAMRLVREAQGKESSSHNYSNEARLINWALAGSFKGIDRDFLSQPELTLLAKLEVKNAVMLAHAFPYEDRKTALKVYAAEIRSEASAKTNELGAKEFGEMTTKLIEPLTNPARKRSQVGGYLLEVERGDFA